MTALEWITTIAVIVLIVLSLTLCTIALRKLMKEEGFARRWIAILVLAVSAPFIVYLAYNLREIEPADWAQIMLMLGLVAVTGAYALSAAKQADASAKLAEETREHRYSESLPLLVPTTPPILNTDELPYESVQSGMGMKVIWRNVGKGVAINSRFSFWTAPTSPGKATFFPPCESVTLEVGGSKILDDGQLTAISDAYQPKLEAEYRDTYERKITTVQEFRVDEQKQKVFLGELYFTVNGKRFRKGGSSA